MERSVFNKDEESDGSDDDYMPSDVEHQENSDDSDHDDGSDDNDDDGSGGDNGDGGSDARGNGIEENLPISKPNDTPRLLHGKGNDGITMIRNFCESNETEDERQKRLDALFQDFIGTDIDPNTSNDQTLTEFSVSANTVKATKAAADELSSKVTQAVHDDTFRDKAADSGVVSSNIVHKAVNEGTKSIRTSQDRKRENSNGLTNAISTLSKKSKMSILDKTAQDWGAFKKEKGIQEELSSHNRGKQGYVERVEFLTRTDFRQFEMEREARNAARLKK